MTQQIINVGSVPNDGDGDPLRLAFQKINYNFAEVYAAGGAAGTDGQFQLRALNSLTTLSYYNSTYVIGGYKSWWTSADATSFEKNTVYIPSVYIRDISASTTGFIAVGDAGTILTSGNGISWTSQTPVSAVNFKSVAYDYIGRYCAVGAAGAIQTSLNSINWSTATSGTSNTLNSVIWAAGKWVAVGDSGTIVYSTNGTTWTVVSPAPTVNNLRSVTYDGTFYTTVGNGGTILKSSNATVWTSVSTAITVDLYSITSAILNLVPTSIIAGSGASLYRSINNSSTWASPTSYTAPATEYSAVKYLNGQYIAVGTNGAIVTSTDGNTWTNVSIAGVVQGSSVLYYTDSSNTLNIGSNTAGVSITGTININTSNTLNTLNVGYTNIANVNIRTSTTLNGKVRLPLSNSDPLNTVSEGGDIYYNVVTGKVRVFNSILNSWESLN